MPEYGTPCCRDIHYLPPAGRRQSQQYGRTFIRQKMTNDDDDDPKLDEDFEPTNGEDAEENNCGNWPIRNIKEPQDNDVLYGRGGRLYNCCLAILVLPILGHFFSQVRASTKHCTYVLNIHNIFPMQAPPTTTWATSGFAEWSPPTRSNTISTAKVVAWPRRR
jgi:hypothetical protein